MCRCGGGEPNAGADVPGASPVPLPKCLLKLAEHAVIEYVQRCIVAVTVGVAVFSKVANRHLGRAQNDKSKPKTGIVRTHANNGTSRLIFKDRLILTSLGSVALVCVCVRVRARVRVCVRVCVCVAGFAADAYCGSRE
jgi:hypothetical protein